MVTRTSWGGCELGYKEGSSGSWLSVNIFTVYFKKLCSNIKLCEIITKKNNHVLVNARK